MTLRWAIRLGGSVSIRLDILLDEVAFRSPTQSIIVADPLYMYEMGVGVTLIDRQDPQGEPTATHGFVTPWGTFLGVTRQ